MFVDDLYLPLVSLICFDGEGEGEGEGEGAGEGAGAGAGAGGEGAGAGAGNGDPNPGAKLFSDPKQQAKFNAALAEEKRKADAKLKSQLEKTNRQLAELLESKTLSEAERAKAEEAREDILKQLRTKEENAKIEKKKLEERYETEIVTLKRRAEDAERKYNDSTINRALLDAAVKEDAFNPEVLVTFLRGQTKFNAEGTAVVVDINDKDEAGDPKVMQMSPEDAVKWMKGRPDQFGGLFKSNVVSGVGGSSGSGPHNAGKNGKIDVTKLSDEQFMELWKKDKSKLDL